MGERDFRGQALDEAGQSRALAAAKQLGPHVAEDRRGQVAISGRECVLDRILGEIARSEPGSCSAMEVGDHGGFGTVELQSEKLVEQVMEAEPVAVLVERYEEEIRLRHLGKHRPRVVEPKDFVAERRAEAVEYRGPYEELPGRPIEPREDLVREVLRDVTLTPGELARTPSWIVFVTQPEGGQSRGRPATPRFARRGEPPPRHRGRVPPFRRGAPRPRPA